MKTTTIRYYGVRDVPWTWRGRNLAELRRTELRPIARALDVNAGDDKRSMLEGVLARLRALELAPGSLEDQLQLGSRQEAPSDG